MGPISMNIELLFTGDELMDGRVVNSNAATIGDMLNRNGWVVQRVTTVGDPLPDQTAALREAVARADILIMTGGLGPTDDDRTLQMLSDLSGLPLVQYPEAVNHIESYFKLRNYVLAACNYKQTWFPQGAVLIPNPRGSAMGCEIQIGDCTVFALPGVPVEMQGMMQENILPKLQARNTNTLVVETRILKCFGLGESTIQEKIQDLYPLPTGLELGFQVKFPEVHLRLRMCAESEEVVKQTLQSVIAAISERLHPNPYALDADTFITLLDRRLRKKNWTLALAESCTGGLISSMIAAEPGVSDWFIGSAIVYAYSAKTEFLGVPEDLLNTHGAVSRIVAETMAEGVCRRLNTQVGIAVTGIAGPGGATPEKPVGTVHIAVAITTDGLHFSTHHKQLALWGTRNRIQHMAAFHALQLCIDSL